LKRLKLTRIVIKGVLRGARTGTIAKLAKEFNLDEAWSKTSYAKRFDADKKRSATTDFDRFKIMVLRKQRSFAAKTKNAKAGGKAPAKAAPKAAAKKK
jgi:large subunit ribosomal protein L14e